MQTPGSIDDKAATVLGAVIPTSPVWIPDNEQVDFAHLQLSEHAGAAAELSWEQILVDAGLDRESREMSPAERALADRLRDSGIGAGRSDGWCVVGEARAEGGESEARVRFAADRTTMFPCFVRAAVRLGRERRFRPRRPRNGRRKRRKVWLTAVLRVNATCVASQA